MQTLNLNHTQTNDWVNTFERNSRIMNSNQNKLFIFLVNQWGFLITRAVGNDVRLCLRGVFCRRLHVVCSLFTSLNKHPLIYRTPQDIIFIKIVHTALINDMFCLQELISNVYILSMLGCFVITHIYTHSAYFWNIPYLECNYDTVLKINTSCLALPLFKRWLQFNDSLGQ